MAAQEDGSCLRWTSFRSRTSKPHPFTCITRGLPCCCLPKIKRTQPDSPESIFWNSLTRWFRCIAGFQRPFWPILCHYGSRSSGRGLHLKWHRGTKGQKGQTHCDSLISGSMQPTSTADTHCPQTQSTAPARGIRKTSIFFSLSLDVQYRTGLQQHFY